MQKQPDAASLDCSRESFNKKQQILQSLKCLRLSVLFHHLLLHSARRQKQTQNPLQMSTI